MEVVTADVSADAEAPILLLNRCGIVMLIFKHGDVALLERPAHCPCLFRLKVGID